MASNDGLGSSNRLRRAAESGTRRSGARAAVFWAVTILAGLMAALMITRYLDRRAVPASPVTKIVVAAVDLPLATKLRSEHVKLVEWPASSLPQGAIRDPKDVVDRIVITRVLEGELILPGKLAAKDAGNGLAALIPANMRAVAVRVDDVVGVAGFIHSEDHVDVIVTIRPTHPSDAEPVSKVILQNVKVLAVGKEIDSEDRNRNQANPVTVATLLVNPEQSEKLALAANEGRLLLSLRSWTDTQSVATEGMNPSVLLADARQPEAPPLPAPLAVAPAAPAPVVPSRRGHTGGRRNPPADGTASRGHDVVEILRGDRFEERKFDSRENK